MDVKVEELNGALENVYATSIDQSEVTNLLNEMRDAHSIEIGGGMQDAGKGGVSTGSAA